MSKFFMRIQRGCDAVEDKDLIPKSSGWEVRNPEGMGN